MTSQATQFRLKPLQAQRREGRVVNAMSVDVEDYFQVQALASQFPRDIWDAQPLRVEATPHRVLDLVAEQSVKATFFPLAWVAKRCPQLVRRIVEEGHELASHGTEHRRADEQNHEQFRADVSGSKKLLEDLGGVAVTGYRAPTFSIGEKNLWAFDVLGEEGYAYSSSVYPVKRDFYGMPQAPRFAFFPREDRSFTEIPMTTVRLGERNLPSGGGGFFRLLPLGITSAGISRVNADDQLPSIFYFHPWEIDPEQPRASGLSFKSRFRHYINLDKTESRLRRLVKTFAWDRMDRVFLSGTAH
jgi:polysaccharide deacetylase family protein (PEP-CTERM system associated)